MLDATEVDVDGLVVVVTVPPGTKIAEPGKPGWLATGATELPATATGLASTLADDVLAGSATTGTGESTAVVADASAPGVVVVLAALKTAAAVSTVLTVGIGARVGSLVGVAVGTLVGLAVGCGVGVEVLVGLATAWGVLLCSKASAGRPVWLVDVVAAVAVVAVAVVAAAGVAVVADVVVVLVAELVGVLVFDVAGAVVFDVVDAVVVVVFGVAVAVFVGVAVAAA